MNKLVLLTTLGLLLITLEVSYAKPIKEYSSNYNYSLTSKKIKKYKTAKKHGVGPRPSRWCGWYMRTIFGGGPEYNLARNWAKRGKNSGGPRVGAVVVWRSHVGLITGKASNGKWIVKSGNDSNRVRERPRSLAKAIAFRIL